MNIYIYIEREFSAQNSTKSESITQSAQTQTTLPPIKEFEKGVIRNVRSIYTYRYIDK